MESREGTGGCDTGGRLVNVLLSASDAKVVEASKW